MQSTPYLCINLASVRLTAAGRRAGVGGGILERGGGGAMVNATDGN